MVMDLAVVDFQFKGMSFIGNNHMEGLFSEVRLNFLVSLIPLALAVTCV